MDFKNMFITLSSVLCVMCTSFPLSADAPKQIKEAEELLQQKNYSQVISLLSANIPKEYMDYAHFLRLIALYNSKKLDQALDSANQFMKTYPQSSWLHKVKFFSASILIEKRDYESAEALFKKESLRLLSNERKAEIAAQYISFAEYFSYKPKPEELDLPQPDYNKAYSFYEEAFKLEIAPDLKEKVRFNMAKMKFLGEDYYTAQREYEKYLKEFDPDWKQPNDSYQEINFSHKGEFIYEARLNLAETFFHVSSFTSARIVLEDIIALSTKHMKEPSQKETAEKYHRLASRRLPFTYRFPRPDNDYELESSIKGVDDFISEYPSDSLAVTLMWYTTQALIFRNRTDQAIKKLKQFINKEGFTILAQESTEEIRLRESIGFTLTPEEQFDKFQQEALFQLGNLTFKQTHYSEAINIFSDYISRFPNGSYWTKAQSGIIDAEYQIGVDLLASKKYKETEDHWNDFLVKHPLDDRSRKILFTLAQINYEEANKIERDKPEQAATLYQKAVSGYRKLVSKYPNTNESSLAQLKIGEIYEEHLSDLEAALTAYKTLTWGSYAQEAQGRVQKMINKELVLRTDRIFRTTEEAYITVQLRNIDKLKLSAYKLNLEAYFRKSHSIKGVEHLDLALIEPDRKWEIDVKGYGKYLPLEKKIDITMDGPGVYAINVASEELEATTLVIRTDIDLIMKSSRKELLVFIQDMVKGKTIADAKVLITDGTRVLLEDKTGKDGVLLKILPELTSVTNLNVFASFNGHIAATGLDLAGLYPAVGLRAKGYIYTDQPAYRPGQQVNIKGILRDVDKGSYIIPHSGEKKESRYFISVVDAKGRSIYKNSLELSEFGTFHTTIMLSTSAPQGDYSIRVNRESGSHYFNGKFIVQEYKLEKIKLKIDFNQSIYFRGETIEATFEAAYYFGQPVKDSKIRYTTPDGLAFTDKTDADGKLRITFDTTPFQPGSILSFAGTLSGENVGTSGTVYLAARGFSMSLRTDRDISLKGEPVEVTVTTIDAAGAKVSKEVEVSMYKRITKEVDPLFAEIPWLEENKESGTSTWTEVKVETKKVTTDDRGIGRVSFSPSEGGQFLFRGQGKDRFNNIVTGEVQMFVSGEDDAEPLRIFAKRSHYSVGEKDSLRIYTRIKEKSLGLITFEGEGIISYHITSLNPGENPFDLAIDHSHFPNFVFTVSVMNKNALVRAKHAFTVERQLNIIIKPRKSIFLPGEEAFVDILVTDHLGKPVEAELSLALVNEALLEQFKDPVSGIVSFFEEGAYREAEMRTDSSCTFIYTPVTQSVNKELQEEDDRLFDLLSETMNYEAVEMAEEEYDYEKKSRKEDKEESYSKSMSDEEYDEEPSGAYDDKPEETREGARRELSSGRYWRATIVSNASGKAETTIPIPDNTSSFKIRMKGCTKETLVGESETTITVRKEFFASLKLPVLVQEKDVIRIVGRIHNLTSYSGKVKAICSVVYNEKSTHLPVQQVDILPNETKEIVFQSYTVPLAKKLEVQLAIDAGGKQSDTVMRDVKIRPWGLPVGTNRADTAHGDTDVFLTLPADRDYVSSWMSIALYPALETSLIDLVLPRQDFPVLPEDNIFINFPIGAEADLLATISMLLYTMNRPDLTHSYKALKQKAYSLVSELVSTQQKDGGWGWQKNSESISITSQAYWALVLAQSGGIEVEDRVLTQAKTFLQKNFTSLPQNDNDSKAEILHALSLTNDADYTFVNRLYRSRNELSEAALAFTALTLNTLSKPDIAQELLRLLDSKAQKVKDISRTVLYWKGENNQAWLQNSIETTALAVLAYQHIEPASTFIEPGIRFLMGQKNSSGFNPPKAVGYASAALTQFYDKTKQTSGDFTLIISVNGTEVGSLDARREADDKDGMVFIEVPGNIIKPGKNHVHIKHSGTGDYSYSMSLTGFSRDMKDPKSWTYPSFNFRKYIHEPLRYKGKKIGSSTMAIHELESTNTAEVSISFNGGSRKSYLVLEEFIPAGATVLEDTIQGSYSLMEKSDGKITFYFKPEQYISTIKYSLASYLPGTYQVLPSVLHEAFRQEEMRIGEAASLILLAPGETSSEEYVMNKEELYGLGKAYFEDGQMKEALNFLEKLYTMDPAYSQPQVARMLLWIRTEKQFYDAAKIVDYFEILKEKYPELSIPFSKILVVGQAYHDIKEYERAYLVYKATIDASFLKDSGVGGYLEKAGEFLASIEYMMSLINEYPNSSPVISAWFALAQEVYTKAPYAPEIQSGKTMKKEEREKIYTKIHFLSMAHEMLRNFLSLYPEHELTDDAAFTILNITLDMRKYQTTIDFSKKYQQRYSKSAFFTNYQYMEALGHFSLRKYSDAINTAKLVAEGDSDNKNLATYILGQIYHARRDPENALLYYKKIRDSFSDASEAIDYFERKSVNADEVTIYIPGETISLPLHYRNIKEAHLQIYKVDLMKLYLREKSLSRITGVNLAGITPLHESVIPLGDGKDYEDKSRDIPLKLKDEGAYLAVIRGDDIFTSGLVLITPLSIEVQEDQVSGRIRVNVFDKIRQLYPDLVHVKAIGSGNTEFVSGDTDLRGIFIADGIRGIPTVIARDKSNRYAFYRGKNWVGPQEDQAIQTTGEEEMSQDFDEQYRGNLFIQQNKMVEENRANLDYLYDQDIEGVMVQEAK